MENLNKNQFILLVLLVTFVTSIATGIMTFSLLQQTPVEVTRTINQVIEKTIDQVTPTTGILSSSQPDKVTTVVVKEEDQVIASINKNIPSIVRINERDSSGGSLVFYGLGIIVNKSGQIVAPRKTILAGEVYSAVLSNGTTVELNPVGVDKNTSFILFVPLHPTAVKTSFTPASFANGDPQLGQTVVGLGGDTTNAVAVGRVISFNMKDMTIGSTTAKTISSIQTDIATKDIVDGSPIFNLSGDIIGVELADSTLGVFTLSANLKQELPALIQSIP